MRQKPPIPPPPPGCDPDSIVIAYEVFRDFAGIRLDRFIQRRIPRLSRSRAQQVIRECAFTAEGRPRRPSELVREGEVVLLVRQNFEEPDVPTDFDVLHEDADLLALDKPAGLPVHRSASYHRNTLGFLLRERYGDDPATLPRIAHRLDRETSGVVLCARNRRAEQRVKLGFETRRWRKRYVAIVRGAPPPKGVVDLPMGAVREGLHVMMETRDDGAPAETHFELLEQRGHYALVSLSPHTGRQHQLRVHMAAVGHPIVGDKLYGPEAEAPFLEQIETGLTPELLARLELPRQALHAQRLSLEHPSSGAPLTLEAPMPADMAAFWDSCGSRTPHPANLVEPTDKPPQHDGPLDDVEPS